MPIKIENNSVQVRYPYFYTLCELCGWEGSSEGCLEDGCVHSSDYNVICPSCLEVFLCEEVHQ